MKRLWLAFLLLFISTICHSQNTTITGTLQGPGGAAMTGTLWLSLPEPVSVLSSCSGGPALLVPSQFTAISIVNGTVQGTPKVWGADCMAPLGGFPYNVKVTDQNNNVLFTDQWLILGSTYDIGNAISLSPPSSGLAYVGQWQSTITYSAGQMVSVVGTGITNSYVSLINNNLNNSPPTSSGDWLELKNNGNMNDNSGTTTAGQLLESTINAHTYNPIDWTSFSEGQGCTADTPVWSFYSGQCVANGAGTVSSAEAKQIAYYSAAGIIVSGNAATLDSSGDLTTQGTLTTGTWPSSYYLTMKPLGTMDANWSIDTTNASTFLSSLSGAAIYGTPTAGHCVEWYSATQVEDLGEACGSGSSVTFPTGILYGNNSTSAPTAATSTEMQTAIGSSVYDAYGAASTAQSNAETYASNASNLSSGAVGSARIPAATTSAIGGVKTDGSTITNSSGTISCTTATTSQLGCIKPDGSTITISGGVISSTGGGSMTWPSGSAGIPNYSGSSSWGTTYNASNLIPDTFVNWAAPGAIGSGTPNTGEFTTFNVGDATTTPILGSFAPAIVSGSYPSLSVFAEQDPSSSNYYEGCQSFSGYDAGGASTPYSMCGEGTIDGSTVTNSDVFIGAGNLVNGTSEAIQVGSAGVGIGTNTMEGGDDPDNANLYVPNAASSPITVYGVAATSGGSTTECWNTAGTQTSCPSSGGSGTVSSGTLGYPAMYTSTGTTVGSSPDFLDATLFSGSDVGAKINAAYADCPSTGCTIYIPQGSYSFSTPIVFGTSGKVVVVQANNARLTYTASSGTALSIQAPGTYTSNAVYNLYLTTSVSGTTSVGIASGTSSIDDEADRLVNVTVIGFKTGIADYSYNLELDNSTIDCASLSSSTGFTTSNAADDTKLIGGSVDACAIDINNGNTNPIWLSSIVIGDATTAGIENNDNGIIHCSECHMVNTTGAANYLTNNDSGGLVYFSNSSFEDDATTGSSTAPIVFGAGYLNISNSTIYSAGATYSEFIEFTGSSSSADLSKIQVVYTGTFNLYSQTNEALNTVRTSSIVSNIGAGYKAQDTGGTLSDAYNLSTHGDQAVSLSNSDFEGSTLIPPPGWIGTDSTTVTSYETSSPYTGKTHSLKMTTSTQYGGLRYLTTFAVVPGNAYKVQCAMKGDGTSTPLCALEFLTITGSYVNEIYASNASTFWTLETAYGIAPATAVEAIVLLENGTASGAGTSWFDDISVHETHFINAITSSLGGSSLSAHSCTTTTVTIPGVAANLGMTVSVTPNTNPSTSAYFTWNGVITASNTVTVSLCNWYTSAETPTASTYNVNVLVP